jgi:hypothetical protein
VVRAGHVTQAAGRDRRTERDDPDQRTDEPAPCIPPNLGRKELH